MVVIGRNGPGKYITELTLTELDFLREARDTGTMETPAPQTGTMVSKPWRTILLEEATKITASDRNKQYGNPEDNFQNIVDLWNAFLRIRFAGRQLTGCRLTSADVAQMMILMKSARLATNPAHWDSLVDQAGYAACGGDIAKKSIPAAETPKYTHTQGGFDPNK